jgi:hypothetical protein
MGNHLVVPAPGTVGVDTHDDVKMIRKDGVHAKIDGEAGSELLDVIDQPLPAGVEALAGDGVVAA